MVLTHQIGSRPFCSSTEGAGISAHATQSRTSVRVLACFDGASRVGGLGRTAVSWQDCSHNHDNHEATRLRLQSPSTGKPDPKHNKPYRQSLTTSLQPPPPMDGRQPMSGKVVGEGLLSGRGHSCCLVLVRHVFLLSLWTHNMSRRFGPCLGKST